MPNFLDFSSVPSNEPVPPGNYLVVVENVEERENKEGKIDPDTNEVALYWAWEFSITEGDFANRRLWVNTSLQKKALWKLRTLLINLGAFEQSMSYETDEDTHQVIEPELVGRVGTAVVKMGKDQNKNPRPEVDTILDADGVDLEKAMRKESKAATSQTDDVPASNGASPRPERAKMTLR